MRYFSLLLILTAGLLCCLRGELETRVHRFEYAEPEWVERQVRALVADPHRVSMNPRANEVMVITDAETHTKVEALLRVLGRPPRYLRFKVKHNRELLPFRVADGVPLTLPVSQTPPAQLVEIARTRLGPEDRNLPVAGTALQVQVMLLRENPDVVRMRIFPAVLFGPLQPYKVIRYEDLTMDIMVDTENYLEFQDPLGGHAFYRQFLQTQPDPSAPPRPVSLVVSFEGVEYGDGEGGP